MELEGELGKSYISSLSIFSDDYRKINSNIEVKSYFSSNYKFLNFLLTEFNINKNFPKNLEGEVSGFLKISNKKNNGSYRYFFEGSLDNFYHVNPNNNIPIVLNDFNGGVLLSNDLIKIEGNGILNGSQSGIKILVDKEERIRAEQALGAAAGEALAAGAIQVAIAVVVARNSDAEASAL